MTENRTSPRRSIGCEQVQPVRWIPLVALTAALTLLTGCSSNSGSASATSVASVPAAGNSPVPNAPSASSTAVEAVPSLAPETTLAEEPPAPGGGNGGATGGGGSSGTINVKAPTLGSNFSGEGDWGPEDVELADLHITVAPDGEAHYNFGVFTISGEDGLTYGDTSLSPDGTYFSLTSSCAGTPIATSKNAVADSGDSARCNQLSFDPGSPASASDPFDAVLVLRFQVTCTGQQSDTCRHVSASAAHPVVLHFSRSIKLHGAVEPPSSVGSGEATNPAMNSAAPQDSSPPGGSQANPAPPAESAPAEASVAAPGSGG